MSRAIPPELLLHVFGEVEGQTDLLSIRLTSRAMSSLVTPICFRNIHVSDTPDRVMDMMSLQQNQTLASLVEQIVFRQKVDGKFHDVTTVQYGTHNGTELTGMHSSLDAHSKSLTLLLYCYGKFPCSTTSAVLSPTCRLLGASNLSFSFSIASA
jgi:hypothetical protein